MTAAAIPVDGQAGRRNGSRDRSTHRAFLLTLTCCLAQASIGYASSIAGLIPKDTSIVNNARYAYLVGTVVGAMCTFALKFWLGRKGTFAAAVAVAASAGIVQSATSTVAVALLGCLLAGFACGMIGSIAPVWQLEAVGTHMRGRLVVLQICAHIGGSALAAWSSWLYEITEQQEQVWRVPVAMQLVLQLSALALLPLLNNDAKKPDGRSLKRRGARPSWRITLGGLLQLLTGYCGSSTAIATLLIPVLSNSGLSASSTTIVGLSCTSCLFLGSVITVWTVDSVGRRGTLKLTLADLTAAYFLITILLAAPESRALAVAVTIILFVAAAWAGILFPIPWLYQAEINTTAWRVLGSAIGTIAQAVSSDVVIFTQGSMHRTAWPKLWRYSLPLTIISAASLVVVHLLYPETARQSLADMDVYFESATSFMVRKGCTKPQSNISSNDEAVDLEKRADFSGNPEKTAKSHMTPA